MARGFIHEKNQRTLRRMLIPFFCLAAGIPIVIFAVISQIRLRANLEASVDSQIQANMNKSNQCLDMVLDKYDKVLYDFSTDVEVADLAERDSDSQGQNVLMNGALQQKMREICRQNQDVEGITVVMQKGNIAFYDRLNDSYTESSWAGDVTVPDITTGVSYKGCTEPIEDGKERVYLFQIARRLVDFRDIQKNIGTVVLSLNENVLDEALETGDLANVYLLQKGMIVSSRDNNDIGKPIGSIKKERYKYTSAVNLKSKLYIYNGQPLTDYSNTLTEQIIIWVLIAAAMIGVISIISYQLTVPYLKEIDLIMGAMNQVEQGDLQVKLQVNDSMPVEIRRISSGFNDLVEWVNALIGQVKESAAEQKNAELSALEAQIDPHFLYNTLATINWKAIEKEEFEISEMINALADILRYSVKNPGASATIGQEIYWIQQYMLLQRAKLDQELEIKTEIPEELYGYQIHKLLLQPFIENAVRHGLKCKEGLCKLTISMRRIDNQIHIIIRDNGCGIDQVTLKRLNSDESVIYDAEHMGVANVRKRLKLYYGEEAALYFESRLGIETKVHLFIPMITTNDSQLTETEEGNRDT